MTRKPPRNIGCRQSADGSDDALWVVITRMMNEDETMTASDALRILAKQGAKVPVAPRPILTDEATLERIVERVLSRTMDRQGVPVAPSAIREPEQGRVRTQGGAKRL